MEQLTISENELRFKTSYGVIRAKTWGSFQDQKIKVLAVHGWQDNAGTFDTLFPLLPLDFMYIVAVDLPGHGQSSHLPKGVPYTDMTWVIELKRILDQLQWTHSITIVAHSMGANASLELAALYPDLIDRLVMIDTIKHRITEASSMASEMAKSILLFTNSQRISSQQQQMLNVRTFNTNEAIRLIIETHYNGSLTETAARCLMTRAVCHSSNGLVFTRDPRLNCMVNRKFNRNQLLSYLSNIRCRLMIIRAKQTHSTLRCRYEKDFLELYRSKCDQFEYYEVDGDHYVHLTRPKTIADHICNFFHL